MSCIVGLNDAEDEQNKWLRVIKDVEAVCVRQAGERRSSAADVVRNRANNDVGSGDEMEKQLLGREGMQERQTLRKIKRVQKVAAKTAEGERQSEASMFQVRPSKLVVPTQDSPLSLFEAKTWCTAFPDLFPWADGVPFLRRETDLGAAEVFRYLLLREELVYSEPDVSVPLPRWSLSALWSGLSIGFNVFYFTL